MIDKYEITSADGKKRLVIKRSSVQTRHWEVEVRLVMEVQDIATGETKQLTSKPSLVVHSSDIDNHARIHKTLVNESAIQFYKLVVRKEEALEAYRTEQWDTLKELVPLYSYVSEFVRLFASIYLSAEWVHAPATATRTAQINSRGSYKDFNIIVLQKLTYNPISYVGVRAEFALHIGARTNELMRKAGMLTFAGFYPPGEWPTAKVFLAEERTQRLLEAWLHDILNDSSENPEA